MNKLLIVIVSGLALTACMPNQVRLAEQASVQAAQAGIEAGHQAVEAGHQAVGSGYQAIGDLAQAQAATANSNTAALQVAAKSIDAAMKAAGWAFWSSTMTNILLFIIMVAFIALCFALVWRMMKNPPRIEATLHLDGGERREPDRLNPPDVVFREPLRKQSKKTEIVVKRGNDWRY